MVSLGKGENIFDSLQHEMHGRKGYGRGWNGFVHYGKELGFPLWATGDQAEGFKLRRGGTNIVRFGL